MNPNKALWEKGDFRASRQLCGKAEKRSSKVLASKRALKSLILDAATE